MFDAVKSGHDLRKNKEVGIGRGLADPVLQSRGLISRRAEHADHDAAASSAGRAAKVHSSWPGPHSFSIERSGNPIVSKCSVSAESTGCIKSMLDSEW